MIESSSYKTVIAALITAIFALVSVGCDQTAPKAGSGLNNSGSSSASATRSDNRDNLDLGQDWDHRVATSSQSGRASGRSSQSAPPSAPATPAASVPQDQPYWAIVLGTFSGENHAQSASTMVRELQKITPQVASARVHSTTNGSLVIFGAYATPEDARATRDLKMVKELQSGGRLVYPRAFLTRVTPPAARPGALHPHDLRSARRTHPNVDPLYSLQIAVWSDFGSGQLSQDEIRRRAEQYTAEQRAQGVEAYFHHDERERISIVTVGLFDRSAIEHETGLFSPEVLRYKRRYPAHLVNGEPLTEPINRLYPERGTRVQEPRLVVVPR
ncbi:MAG TPA: hypothetical protein PK400_04705 [Phycisphaerales bacterium]|nr:hypothetical protein [Phycisphaerales bacterium]HRQ75321.1 hypothetical protein [Phycisphaerales bacterium]